MGFIKSVIDFIPNIINAGAQIHATNAAARTAKYNTNATNAANQKMAEYEYNKNLEMWKMQNEYNTPQRQMQRFSAAGLSPNLIYGQGNPGNATTLPKYSAPRQEYNYQPKDYTNVIGQYQDFAMKKANIDLAKENIEYTKQKTVNEGLETTLKAILQSKGLIDLQTYSEMNNARLSNIWTNIGKTKQDTVLSSYNTQIKKKQLQNFDKLLQQQMSNTEANILRNRSTTQLLDKQVQTYNLGLMGKLAPGAINLLRAIFGK